MPKIIRRFIVAVLIAMLFGLASLAIPAYANAFSVVHHFDTMTLGALPYTIGGIAAPAPSVDREQNAPGSSGGALRFTYPANWPPGYEPGKSWVVISPQVEELWTEYWFKYSSGFQFQQTTNKHVYWVLSYDPREGDFTLMTNGSRKMFMGTQPKAGGSSGTHNVLLYANLSYDPTIEAGVWYKATVHIKLNTATNPYNGIFRLWINDTPVMNHTNVNYRSGAHINAKMSTLELVPVWGGGGGPNKAKTDYFWMDAIRVQTAPITIGGSGSGSNNLVPMAPSNVAVN